MKRKLLSSIAIVLMLAAFAGAQNPTQPQPITATTISLPLLNPPAPPASANIQTTGTPGPSSNTVYYWLVSEFAIGNSSPAGPFEADNVPATLTSSNYETISWPSVLNALSYDVLKTTTNVPPTGACACAVTVGTTSLSVQDQSTSTSSYTVNTFNAPGAQIQIDNENNGTAGVSMIYARQSGAPAQFPDGIYKVSPNDCSLYVVTGAWAANSAGAGGLTIPAIVRVAANNWVLQGVTTAAANAIALNCEISVPSRLTAGHGAMITGMQLFYGVQTTALTSITTPTLSSVTYNATGGSAAGAVAATGGTLAVTPGTLQLATTTSGQCYSENITLGSPILLNNALKRVELEQIFNQTASAATQLQICGLVVYYTNIPL
jgi:hypothetical protein